MTQEQIKAIEKVHPYRVTLLNATREKNLYFENRENAIAFAQKQKDIDTLVMEQHSGNWQLLMY
jgi:hypothetical protein